MREIGVDLRIGLHTGECDVVGDKLRGIAVHIGARVASKARDSSPAGNSWALARPANDPAPASPLRSLSRRKPSR